MAVDRCLELLILIRFYQSLGGLSQAASIIRNGLVSGQIEITDTHLKCYVSVKSFPQFKGL